MNINFLQGINEMQIKEKPVPDEGTSHRQKYFKHPQHTTGRKNLKSKSHWSRKHIQRQRDAELLAFFGLAFKAASGTTFFRLVRIGGQHE